MPFDKLGPLIGGGFGLVYVLANTGSLPPALGTTLRILGVLAYLVAVGIVLVGVRRPSAPPTQPRPAVGGFGPGYWLVVAAEVVAIFGGLALLNGPLNASQAAVSWVSVVVGAHFFLLAAVWELPFFNWLAGAILLCGVAGLVLVAADASKAVTDTVGGVLPGAVLLAFTLWGVTTSAGSAEHTGSTKRS